MSKKRGLKPRLCHCGGRSFPSREMSSPILPSVWPPPENGLMFDLYNARRVAASGGHNEGSRRIDAYEFVAPMPWIALMEGSVVVPAVLPSLKPTEMTTLLNPCSHPNEAV